MPWRNRRPTRGVWSPTRQRRGKNRKPTDVFAKRNRKKSGGALSGDKRHNIFYVYRQASVGGLRVLRNSTRVRVSVRFVRGYGRVVFFFAVARIRARRRILYVCVGGCVRRGRGRVFFAVLRGGKRRESVPADLARRVQRVLVLFVFRTACCCCGSRSFGSRRGVVCSKRDTQFRKKQDCFCGIVAENGLAFLSLFGNTCGSDMKKRKGSRDAAFSG